MLHRTAVLEKLAILRSLAVSAPHVVTSLPVCRKPVPHAQREAIVAHVVSIASFNHVRCAKASLAVMAVLQRVVGLVPDCRCSALLA